MVGVGLIGGIVIGVAGIGVVRQVEHRADRRPVEAVEVQLGQLRVTGHLLAQALEAVPADAPTFQEDDEQPVWGRAEEQLGHQRHAGGPEVVCVVDHEEHRSPLRQPAEQGHQAEVDRREVASVIGVLRMRSLWGSGSSLCVLAQPDLQRGEGSGQLRAQPGGRCADLVGCGAGDPPPNRLGECLASVATWSSPSVEGERPVG